MTTKTLATHYGALTPEERFRLILAAHARGDDTEAERLVGAAQRWTFSNVDYSPFAHALQEVQMITFMELIDEAARHDEARVRFNDVVSLRNGDTEDRANLSACLFQAYRIQIFILQTKAAGWNLFCERIGFAPFSTWQHLPGFDRLERALDGVAQCPALSPAELLESLNGTRPDGEPEVTAARLISADKYADEIERTFRVRAQRWGAK